MNMSYYIPTRILFGPGALQQAAEQAMPGCKALIVTDGNLAKTLGYLDRVTQLLEKQGVQYCVFNGVTPNPTDKGVEEANAQCRKENCDFVIGLGGGSSIDTAKAVALTAKHDGPIWDLAVQEKADSLTRADVLPIVVVATSAGTGTECDPWSVITNTATRSKDGFHGDLIYPTISIIDPELMRSIPPKQTAFMGMDALFHAAEGYVSKFAAPLSELYSLEAVRLVTEYLPRAVKDGNDIEARTNVSYAANVLCGFVQSISSCAAPHKLGETIGGLYPGVPHGASILLFIEKYYELVEERLPERFAALSSAMGAKTFTAGLKQLMEECGVASLAMSAYGIAHEELPALAAACSKGGFKRERFLLTEEEVLGIFEASYR